MKKLELKKPVSNCYQFMAFPLSIMENYAPSYEWIYSNFIQTCFDLNFHSSPVPFYFYIYDYTISPFLHTQKLNREFLSANQLNIIQLVENSIDDGHYIYLNLDEFYVPKRHFLGKEHFSHDVLIYGNDRKTKEIYLYGFDENLQMAQTVISYDDFELAYNSVGNIDAWANYIHLYKTNEEGTFHLDRNIITEQISEYLNGSNSSQRFAALRQPWDRAYGIDFYKHISAYFNSCEKNNIPVDVKIFHFLYEHKFIMKQRIEYMFGKNMISDETLLEKLDGIVNDSVGIRNAILRGKLTKVYKYESLEKSLMKLQNDEICVLTKIVENIKKL